MDAVYKYCGKHGLTILRNLELLVRPPNQFNDPFEFTPRMSYSDPVRYANKHLENESVLKWLYDSQCLLGKFHGSFSKFKELTIKHKSKVVEAFVGVLPPGVAQAEKELPDEVSKLFGILCTSKRRDSILMWGHYCDRSCGLVIGFDKSAVIFQQEKGLQPVNYVKERVVFDSCWENGTPEMDSYNHKLIFSKSEDWIYEGELRQFFWLSKLKSKLLDDGTIGHFIAFPAEAIVSVTLGPRCSPEFEKDVQETVLKPPFSDVKLERAVLNKNNFIIEFEPLKLAS
jgi:hypothetical protein